MVAVEELRKRPTDMLQRQLLALRMAARPHKVTRKRTFAHLPLYRPHFVQTIWAIRRVLWLRTPGPHYVYCTGDHTCLMCSGAVCRLCATGWPIARCEHDSLERHQLPEHTT